MNYTNLNIKSGGKTFKYIVEYFDDETVKPQALTYFYNEEHSFFFFDDEQQNMLHEKNYWNYIAKEDTLSSEYIPAAYNISSFDLYFPRFSVETYQNNVYYVLTLNTWINGKCIYLGSYLIDRKNAVAPDKGVRKFLNDEYYEYIRINTVDPFYLIYGDEWKEFRTHFCGEDANIQKNNSASNINVTLTPVKFVNNTWIKLDGYDSSQSVIVINNNKDSNYLNANLKFDFVVGTPVFDCNLIFNEVYEGNFEEYLLETYQIAVDENFTMKYCFVIGDKENPYKYKEHIYSTAETYSQFTIDEFLFDSWKDYIEGMSANVFVIIQRYGEDILVLNSNKVFITEEVFKYLIKQEDNHLRKVDLSNLDMQVNNYNVVNVIKNEVVSVERPNEYKSNIVKPIFVKVQDADSIRLHSSVTENISINLDAYKNKVDAFVLKIGDTNFYEIGRINSGIVFKVIGTNLPDKDGLYYILNNDGELVTTGKYTIV